MSSPDIHAKNSSFSLFFLSLYRCSGKRRRLSPSFCRCCFSLFVYPSMEAACGTKSSGWQKRRLFPRSVDAAIFHVHVPLCCYLGEGGFGPSICNSAPWQQNWRLRGKRHGRRDRTHFFLCIIMYIWSLKTVPWLSHPHKKMAWFPCLLLIDTIIEGDEFIDLHFIPYSTRQTTTYRNKS